MKKWETLELIDLPGVNCMKFNSRGSPVNDVKKITFESDKKGTLLSEMSGEIFLKYNI